MTFPKIERSTIMGFILQFCALSTIIGSAVLWAGDNRWVTHEALDEKFSQQRIDELNDKIYELELVAGICDGTHTAECAKLNRYKRLLDQEMNNKGS